MEYIGKITDETALEYGVSEAKILEKPQEKLRVSPEKAREYLECHMAGS